MMSQRKFYEKLSRELVDKGKLIESGWVSLRAILPSDAPQVQIDEMRNAFFAGAQHLFASIMHLLEADEEPTEKDLLRMAQIDNELKAFIKDYSAKHGFSAPFGGH